MSTIAATNVQAQFLLTSLTSLTRSLRAKTPNGLQLLSKVRRTLTAYGILVTMPATPVTFSPSPRLATVCPNPKIHRLRALWSHGPREPWEVARQHSLQRHRPAAIHILALSSSLAAWVFSPRRHAGMPWQFPVPNHLNAPPTAQVLLAHISIAIISGNLRALAPDLYRDERNFPNYVTRVTLMTGGISQPLAPGSTA